MRKVTFYNALIYKEIQKQLGIKRQVGKVLQIISFQYFFTDSKKKCAP